VSLPSDTHRLVYLALIHRADDFGNFEAESRRMFRSAQIFCKIKTEAAMVKLISDLCDADLVRVYDGNGKRFLHMSGFRNYRSYTSRKAPPSA
jgi:hypothetical protein